MKRPALLSKATKKVTNIHCKHQVVMTACFICLRSDDTINMHLFQLLKNCEGGNYLRLYYLAFPGTKHKKFRHKNSHGAGKTSYAVQFC